MSDQTLTFVQKFEKRPPRAWIGGAEHTAKLDGAKFSYTWRVAGASGTRDLTRVRP